MTASEPLVITGNEKAFAAGVDIRGHEKTCRSSTCSRTNFITRNWDVLRRVSQAADCRGRRYALGGGCELAMMCDLIIRRRYRALRTARDQSWASSRAPAAPRGFPRAVGKSKGDGPGC